jgi:hypothetical protein
MTAISDHQWPPPVDWQKFERITCELFSAEWQCRAELHGRSGQPQCGVDVYDRPSDKAAFERALQIRRKFLGDEHPDTKAVRELLESLSK